MARQCFFCSSLPHWTIKGYWCEAELCLKRCEVLARFDICSFGHRVWVQATALVAVAFFLSEVSNSKASTRSMWNGEMVTELRLDDSRVVFPKAPRVRKHQVCTLEWMKCAYFWNEDTDNGVLEDHLDQKEKSWKIPQLNAKTEEPWGEDNSCGHGMRVLKMDFSKNVGCCGIDGGPVASIGRPTLANLSAAAPVTSKETRRTLLLQVKSTPYISVFSCLILFGHHSTFGLVWSFFCLYSTLRCRAPKPRAQHGAMMRNA